MDRINSLALAEMMCARLCHDLAGPVGAAAAGAELLEDLGAGADAETMALVAASAAGAAARLKFFRTAFGPATAGPQPAATLREAVQAYFASSAGSPGITLDWATAAPAFDGDQARLLLNLVLLAKDCLPHGGRVTVESEDHEPVVIAHGEPAGLTDEARPVLLDGAAPQGPRGAQAGFAMALAAKNGGSLSVSFTPMGLRFAARR